jgi:SPP1 gp7 family putative phage head morphogenesis protein
MSELYNIADQFRAALLRRDVAAQSRLLAEYSRVFGRILRQLARLNQQIEDARARGETVDFAWLLRQERYAALLNQVDDEFRKFADYTERVITAQQADAVQSARADSQALMNAAASEAGISATFNRLPASAVENLVGFLSDGSPLSTLLNSFGPVARQKAEGVLIEAVALGRNPRAIQTALAEALGVNRRRALAIARTETIRAYREATHRSFQQDSDVLEGWYWLAAKSSRTCAACLALDGTFHKLNERMAAHVNCRCTQIPGIKGEPSPIEQTGSQWFAQQDAKTQADILGSPAAAEAYRAGQVRLEDFVGLDRNPRWGDSYHQIGLKRALAGEGAFPGDAARRRNIIPEIFQRAPAQPEPAEDVFARYAAPPRDITVVHNEGTQQALRRLFRRDISNEELAGAVGALDGAELIVRRYRDGVFIEISHPEISTQERVIERDSRGLFVDNQYFRKRSDRPGVGRDSFVRQVLNAQRLGIKYIKTHAAGHRHHPSFNGYYTWPRLGYNARLTPEERAALPREFRRARDLNDLFEMGGADWWKEYGTERDMRFDLDPDSRSFKLLRLYLEYKRDAER